MKIHNVGMFVKDLEKAKEFFMDTFGMEVDVYYEEPENGFKEYILKFPEGAKLEIMTKPEIIDAPKHKDRTGFAHVCIKVDSMEQLDEITEKFKAAGYEILYEPATVGGTEIRAITYEDNVLEVNV